MLGWDRLVYADDIRKFNPGVENVGWFGPGDNELLPSFFSWVDKSLDSN